MDAITPQDLLIALAWYIVFLFSTTCHEASHALVSKLGGDLTAFEGGQVTLDPVPHIRREPFGMVLVPLLTYFTGGWMIGWASAPYDPYWAQRHPRRAALMSLAGPGANLALALCAAIAIKIGIWQGFLQIGSPWQFTQLVIPVTDGSPAAGLALILSLVFNLNLLLAVFNMLPVPPLDGSSAVTLLMGDKLAERWNETMRQPMFALLGLLIAWRVFGYIFRPVRAFALDLLLA